MLFNLESIATSQATQDHSITIFVHGTYIMRKFLQLSPCRSLMYCEQGLSLAKNLPKHYHFHKMAKGCVESDEESYSLDQFYIFGWESEHVNDASRNRFAKILVDQLHSLVVDYYELHNVIPKIRLLGFSHGGNVILRMADHVSKYVKLQNIEIEAWLFGTPVQVITHDLVNSDCFTKIYSIYSKKDWVQRVDPQGMINRKVTKNNFWSNRTFSEDSQCLQIELMVEGKSIKHASYNNIFQHFPKIKKLIEKTYEDTESNMMKVDFKE